MTYTDPQELRENESNPLKIRGSSGTNLCIIDGPEINTSSSNDDSEISGNICITDNATISGRITINSDSTPNADLASHILNNAQITGTNTLRGLVKVGRNAQVSNSTLAGPSYNDWLRHRHDLFMNDRGSISDSTATGPILIEGICS